MRYKAEFRPSELLDLVSLPDCALRYRSSSINSAQVALFADA